MFEKLFQKRGCSLDRLRSFCEIAKADGRLAAVAIDDATKQSQLSRQLKELEDYFEVSLFDRRGRRLHINSAGRRVLAVGMEFFGAMEELYEDFQDLPQNLFLGSGENIINWVLIPNLVEIQ